ncbi:protein kinase domain-containing protein [Jannaschia pohangensis]|uniref:Protein kinase domain-containing protein n=1 Tax=Jannaschia pohangensis TaxID=390807 RepID=A0A1I3V349_9RHOB|nr:protein kinase [Jannaschia pohangensis]SFJ89878.1 Protein kinase domain-containing protein [Jannaschia pohangensis]
MGDATAVAQDKAEDVLPDELAPGTELLHGQYTIDEFINAGGFGMTYRARDSLDRKVVIKECFPGAFCRRSRVIVQARSRAHQTELNSIVRLFVQEARSLSKLQHPNIVGVHQVFEENGTAYMALDFVDGRDLLEIAEDPDTHLPPSQIVSILRDVLKAIGFVHAQDILHRDISPDNILLDADGRPVLIDFGAARQQATKQSRVLSALRVVKDGYSPQEFYITGTEQGPYSDLYALGASFYHLIAGEVPTNAQARLTAIATGEGDPYVPLKGNVEGYDDAFLGAIDRALEVLPKDRLQSAEDWLAMMDGKAMDAPVRATITAAGNTDAEPTKSKTALFAGVAAVALIAAGAGFMLTRSDEPVPGVPAETAQTGTATPEASTPSATLEEIPVETAFSGQPTTPAPAEAATETETEVVAEIPVETPSEAAPAQLRADIVVDSADVDGHWDDLAALRPVPKPVFRPVQRPERPATPPQLRADIDTDTSAVTGGWAELAVLNAERIERDRPVPLQTPTPIAESVIETAFAGSTPPSQVPLSDATWAQFGALPAAPEVISGFAAMAPIDAVFVGEAIEPETPAPADAPQTEVLSGWSIDMPFDGLNADQVGVRRIQSVNGVPVSTVDEFNRVLRSTVDPEGQIEVSLDVGIASGPNEQAILQTWTRPVVQETALLNGMAFETRFENGQWVSRVTNIPDGVLTDMRPGDIIFAFVPTTETLTTRTAMKDLLDREIAAGRTEYSFAVLRGGSNWVAFMTYESLLNN